MVSGERIAISHKLGAARLAAGRGPRGGGGPPLKGTRSVNEKGYLQENAHSF